MARASSPKTVQLKARPRRRWLGWLKWLSLGGLTMALIGGAVLLFSVYTTYTSLPGFDELKQSPNGQTIRVHAADNSVLLTLGPTYGRWLGRDEIPPVMAKAMIAVEDRRFYHHIGVDPIGMVRSLYHNFENRGQGKRMHGASTITQQLARNIFLSNSYTFGRKIKEAQIAMALEMKFSKEEILELYLNKVYFGGGSYGIDAASRRFFGHGATQLSLGEAAIIAGLVKAPSRYAPTADAAAAVARAQVVLDVMRDAGAISASARASANPKLVPLAPEPEPIQNSARYFTDWVLPQLDGLIEETSEPLDLYTTIDPALQGAATAAIKANVRGAMQGALVSLDRDGAVLAMVGGTDYVRSNYNRATQAVRQPGSAWKLFVYLTALEAGYKVDDTVVDKPVTIQGWSPRNSSGRFSGPVSLRTAFAFSLNTVAAQIGESVGYTSIANMARRFGITTPVNTMPSMVLGTSEVRLIDITRAFAAVSAKGVSVTPYGIARVTSASGTVLYERKPSAATQLVDPWVAAGMTDLMQTAINTGTGRAAMIGRPVAGKTGTTSSNKDGWFIGFSSGITTGVWMGRDDARPVADLQGGHAPARAFADYMRIAVASRPIEKFDTAVKLPDWQVDDEQGWQQDYGAPQDDGYSDPNGMPVTLPADPQPETDPVPQDIDDPDTGAVPQRRLDQNWIDDVTGRRTAAPPADPMADGSRPGSSGAPVGDHVVRSPRPQPVQPRDGRVQNSGVRVD